MSGETFLRRLLSMPLEETRWSFYGREQMYAKSSPLGVDPRQIAQVGGGEKRPPARGSVRALLQVPLTQRVGLAACRTCPSTPGAPLQKSQHRCLCARICRLCACASPLLVSNLCMVLSVSYVCTFLPSNCCSASWRSAARLPRNGSRS